MYIIHSHIHTCTCISINSLNHKIAMAYQVGKFDS